MKNNLKNILYAFLVLFLFSCSKEKLSDINKDTSILNEEQLTPDLILNSGQATLAYGLGGDGARFTSLFVQYFHGHERQFAAYETYSISGTDVDNLWRFNLYGGGLEDIKQLINLAKSNGYLHYEGVGNIMMAYAIGASSDLWGDIPYTQAFMGAENTTPIFDNHTAIYDTIQSLLTRGIAQVTAADNSGLEVVNGDNIFDGDLTAWEAFAHSLKARNYLHLVNVNPSNASMAITEAAMGVMDNSGNAIFRFGSASTALGPWTQFMDQRGDITFDNNFDPSSGLDHQFNDTLLAMGDPRQVYYIDNTNATLGSFYYSGNEPFIMMSFAENKFIEAEAKFRTGDNAGAAAAHNDGVSASLDMVTGNIDATYMAAYGAETATSITLEKIMFQKHIAMFLQLESWTDWRRTGFPAITPNDGVGVPRSFLYPDSERLYNPENCPVTNTMLRKLFWDI